jgi:hypothetical protein
MHITIKNKAMFNWYYILWSDAINFTRSKAKFISVWKLHTLGFISFFMAINLMVISMIFKIELNTHFITLISSKALSHFLGFMVVFFLPPLILNYVLIFSKNQWERVRKDYKHYDGKVYKMYFILSIVLPVSFLIILKLAHDFFGFTV